MRKRILALLLLTMTVSMLAGCRSGDRGNELPPGMDKEQVFAQGREVVALLAAEDWRAVYDRLRQDVKQATSAQEIGTYMQEMLQAYGVYQKETDAIVTGQKLDSGEQYATAVIYCRHEKKDLVYRIAFSAEMELIGFQVKKQSLFG